jgi:hypothetical protein
MCRSFPYQLSDVHELIAQDGVLLDYILPGAKFAVSLSDPKAFGVEVLDDLAHLRLRFVELIEGGDVGLVGLIPFNIHANQGED